MSSLVQYNISLMLSNFYPNTLFPLIQTLTQYRPEAPATTVDEFISSKKPVTNAEFSLFVQDGGYRFKDFWVESNYAVDGVGAGKDKENDPSKSWKWIQKHDVQMPIMWTASDKEQGKQKHIYVRTLCDGPISYCSVLLLLLLPCSGVK